jgi:hypothetical protein
VTKSSSVVSYVILGGSGGILLQNLLYFSTPRDEFPEFSETNVLIYGELHYTGEWR